MFRKQAVAVRLERGRARERRWASDVDLLIVVADEDYDARMREGRVQWSTVEACEWQGGYVEGKYLCPRFFAEVARTGSEPARFAFQHARVLFSDLGDLTATLRAVARTVLFGGRMILAHNEQLFRYHKWFLKLLEQAPVRPPDLMERIAALHDEPSQATLLGLCGPR